MANWHFIKFLRASGRIGGGSVIFALLLFSIAIWEHHAGRNVPTSFLTITGVGFFCYGCYLAWLKELREKETILANIEVPKLELTLTGWNWIYDPAKDLTVFFLAASLLNKGHSTSVIAWEVTWHIGSDVEKADLPNLIDEFVIPAGDYELCYRNDDLITVKCREGSIQRGSLLDGRILFTLPRNRADQIRHGFVKIEVKCFDYLEQETKQNFVPSTVPLLTLHKSPREKVIRVNANENK